jgi:hypothetical protein
MDRGATAVGHKKVAKPRLKIVNNALAESTGWQEQIKHVKPPAKRVDRYRSNHS